MSRALRIGTRSSALALAQSRAVAAALDCPSDLVRIASTGDRLRSHNPAAAGGRGVFVRTLEEALLRGQVDLCVHSAKDVPPELPAGLRLAAFPPRAAPWDALVGSPLGDLPPGARVATGSPRRARQLRALRADLRVEPVRGNVDTRLRRVAQGEFAAAVLAQAGLERLGLGAAVRQVFGPDEMVPAAGQGALAVELRADDAATLAAVQPLDDPQTACCIWAERAVLAALGGGCAIPAGALCTPEADGRLLLRAVVCGADGTCLRAAEAAQVPAAGAQNRQRAEALAGRVAAALLAGGAAALLAEAGEAR